MASSNPNNIAPTPTSGIKIAKAGFSVETATDYELLFNSAWPSIAIVFDQSVDVPAGTNVAVAHTLNDYMFTQAYVTNSAGTFVGRAGIEPTLADGGNVGFKIGKQAFYLSGDPSRKYTINIKAYSISLTNQANYTYVAPPPAQIGLYDKHYGAKFVKPGKDFESHDLNDFIFHTQCMSPAILSVLTEKSAETSPIGAGFSQLQYTNPAFYVPWIYGFISVTSSVEGYLYVPSGFAVQSAAGIRVSGDTLTLSFGSNFKATLVVLRDPLFVATTVEVTY